MTDRVYEPREGEANPKPEVTDWMLILYFRDPTWLDRMRSVVAQKQVSREVCIGLAGVYSRSGYWERADNLGASRWYAVEHCVIRPYDADLAGR